MKTKTFMAMAILGILLMSSLCIIPTDDNSAYLGGYGSDNVGAQTITFDSNGGTGGFSQKVLKGNSVYFPTEYKAPSTSDSEYTQISKSGNVLLGWSTDGEKVTRYPGQSYIESSSSSYKAVWADLTYNCIEQMNGSSTSNYVEAEHLTVLKGTSVTLDTTTEEISEVMLKLGNAAPYVKYTLSDTYNGVTKISEVESTTGRITANVFTMTLTKSSLSIIGTVDGAGIHEITLKMQTHAVGSSYGEKDVMIIKWYVSVADGTYDPSIIRHITTEDGTIVGYGPYHTAIQLPDADRSSVKQNGWSIKVDQSPTTYPLGGSYSIIDKDMVLEPSYYTDEEIKDMAGVLAYNANGGSYKGTIAAVVAPGGTATLADGSIVSKTGYNFVGWSKGGSNPIYPAGYLYDIGQEDYTELKAVWGTTSSKATLKYVNTSDATLADTFTLYTGYDYAHPVNVSVPSGYRFVGWSDEKDGTAIDEDSIVLSSNMTFYTVFEKNPDEADTVTVTFVGHSSTVKIVKIQSGTTVDTVKAPSVDCMAFDAWYHNGEKWDFDTAVTENMTLQAKYIKIFELQFDGTSAKVVLNVSSSTTKVTYSSDGHTETFVGETPKAHTLEPGTSGYVTVVVTTENGVYESTCPYSVDDGNADQDDGNDKEVVDIDLTYVTLGVVIAGLIVFAYRRGYL